MADRVIHLQMIQAVVDRMANSSFYVKGWSLTLVTAVLALAGETGGKTIVVAAIPLALFWALDGFFLGQERLYRALYDEVRNRQGDDTDFSMNTAKHASSGVWMHAAFSKTLLLFYGGLIVASGGVAAFLILAPC